MRAPRAFLPTSGGWGALRALPLDARVEAFFVCWTGKEACVKARGEGLMQGLVWCGVSFVAGEPVALPHGAV
jgi:4'-phosphopantetheinyl transferase